MTDLDSRPLSEPVASETIVVKPEIITTITQNMGNKNIDFFFPDYIGYMLPSQSYMSFNIEMEGRGMPIPSPTAGIHSLFNTIRHRDGTNSNLLSEMVQYNTMVGQQYTYAKTEALNNNRLMFEGLQPTDSYDNNLYYEQNTTWASKPFSATLSTASIDIGNYSAKPVQINSTLKTFLLSTEKFLPLNVMGGLRTSLQLEDYRRSLEFTNGSMGVQVGGAYNTGMCPVRSIITDNTQAQFQDVSPVVSGAGYQANYVYRLLDAANVLRGFVNVGAVNPGGALIAANIRYVCTSVDGNTVPNFEDNELSVGEAGGGITTVGKIQVIQYLNLFGNLAPGSFSSPYHVDVGVYDSEVSLDSSVTSNDLLDHFGHDDLRNPYRVVNPIPVADSGNGVLSQFPVNNNPFSVGDMLYINTALNGSAANEIPLGLITGFSQGNQKLYATHEGLVATTDQKALRVYFQPNAIPVTGLPSDNKTGVDATALTNPGGTGYTGVLNASTANGYQLYVKSSDRVNTINQNLINHIAGAPVWNQSLFTYVGQKVGFKINELQYQVKKVMLDPRVAEADMKQAMGSGYTFDCEESFTQLTNLQSTLGPTNQLISNPNITRALGVLSVPLEQNNQFEISKPSLVGVPSHMTNYQYEMGTDGRQPVRAVPVDMASLATPMVQSQHISELIKTNEAFGYFTSNLSKVGMNFAIGRCFSRPNMFYDLMKAGSLMLLANYEENPSGQKLFVHFIHHLRSITFSRMGVSIAN